MALDHDLSRVSGKTRISSLAADMTLPASWYTDPAVLEAEKRHLFFRTWQYACHSSQLERPGDYVTMSIFDQDIVLTCAGDGQIRAFYNVCLHRGHQLVEGAGNASRMTCPYHAWTWALDGRLVGVRRGTSTKSVDKSEICLTPIRVDRLLDFVFVNLDPDAAPLADFAPGLAEDLAARLPGWRDFQRTETATYFHEPFKCNWKALIDNFLECYHCETAHPTFCDMFRSCDIKHFFGPNHLLQHLPSAQKSETRAYQIDLQNDLLDGNFWFLFPNTLFSSVPGAPSVAVSRVCPAGSELTARTSDYLVAPGADPERLRERDVFLNQKTVAEDRALVEAVQRGMHSRGFNQGRYMIDPEEENFTEEGVRFFHNRYVQEMQSAPVA